jgi:tryptophanyl-tRNA synthetase
VDDSLIGNKRRLKTELLPARIEWRKDKARMSFSTEASINLVDDEELLQKMVEATLGKSSQGSRRPRKPA